MHGIGRQTDYAARVVLHLAALGGGAQVPVKEIAARRLLPSSFVRRVVARLAAAGILRTVRGRGGGIGLARPASRISLLDVVNAMEGGLVLNRCVTEPTGCPLGESCSVQRAWTDATRALERRLAALTFAKLAGEQHRLAELEGCASGAAARPRGAPPGRKPSRTARRSG